MWTEKDVKTWKRSDRQNIIYVVVPGRTGWESSGHTTKKKAVEWALTEAAGGVHAGEIDLKTYTTDFFIPGKCPIIEFRHGQGKMSSDRNWSILRQCLEDYLWPQWGRYTLSAIRPGDFHEWLKKAKGTRNGSPLSVQSRNRILTIINFVFDYATFRGVIQANPMASVPRWVSQAPGRDVFTADEIRAMFPADRIKLAEIWGSLQWGVLFMLAADTGLRPQEIAALTWLDWYPDFGGFVVHQAVDHKREIKGLKTARKGAAKKPALVSQRTKAFLEEMHTDYERRVKSWKPGGRVLQHFVFPSDDWEGRPLRTDTMGKQFIKRLEFVKVPVEGNTEPEKLDPAGRTLTLYCLRHTFNTAARTLLADDAALRDLMGHVTAQMTANYDHPEDAAILIRVQGQRDALEKRWG